jgi:hypothetical protein
MAHMHRFGAIPLLVMSLGCLAQDKPAATARDASESVPAEVDQALRDRVTKFYQAHVDGKYRQAEQYVAEDTKDYYYASQKPHYMSFEIKKISYSEHSTKAKVTTTCKIAQASSFGTMTFNLPVTSDWKLEDGLWYWYTDPNVVVTPFGTMKRSQPGAAQSGEPAPAMTPLVSNVADLWKQVTADKSEVRFGSRPGSSEVVIKNGLPGAISLKLLEPAPTVPGLEVKLERNQVPPHQTVRIFFKYTPEAEAPKKTVVSIEVQPTNQTIPIQVVCER